MCDERYPTEGELEFISKYDCSKKPIKPLIDFIEGIWWAHDWGFILKETESEYFGKKIELELHTGGWSGNEDIIRALEKNEWFYCFYWKQSTRGGHYIFEFNADKFKDES